MLLINFITPNKLWSKHSDQIEKWGKNKGNCLVKLTERPASNDAFWLQFSECWNTTSMDHRVLRDDLLYVLVRLLPHLFILSQYSLSWSDLSSWSVSCSLVVIWRFLVITMNLTILIILILFWSVVPSMWILWISSSIAYSLAGRRMV